MDWQQLASLAIVAVAVGMLLRDQLRRRKFTLGQPGACAFVAASGARVQDSVIFRARRGQRPEITLKLK